MLTIDIDVKKVYTAALMLEEATRRKVMLRAMEGGLRTAIKIAQEDYLSGPRPKRLGRVTNRLAGSLELDDHETMTRVLNAKDFEVVGRFGTRVPYGPVHELGTVGAGGQLPDIVPRDDNPTGLLHFQTRDGRWVRTKKVAIPPRPFAGPALKDAKPDFVKRFVFETVKAMEQAKEEA